MRITPIMTALVSKAFAAIALTATVILGAGCATSTPDDAAFEARVLEILRAHPEASVPEARVLDIVRGHGDVVIAAVQATQDRQAEAQQLARSERLRKLSSADLIGESPRAGAPAGDIVLVEFSDFECPFCGEAYATVKRFMADHGEDVTLVYKHLPLIKIHPQALPAARAAWAAGQQGKFWEYHDMLFGNQAALNESFLQAAAGLLGLDTARWEADRVSEAAGQAINEDIKLAIALGLEGTPTFVLGGESVSGAVPLGQLEAMLARARATSKNDSTTTAAN